MADDRLYKKILSWAQERSWLVGAAIVGIGAFVTATSVEQRVSGGRGSRRAWTSDNVVQVWEVEAGLLGLGVFLMVAGIFFALKYVRR